MEFSSPVVYSMVYNGVYLIPETVICLLLALLVAKPVMRIMKTGNR
jgi:thiamine transporter ThiT